MAIYLSPMNTFVAILTDRLTTWGFKKKCKIRSIGVTRGSRDPILEFWDPLRISGTVEARIVNMSTVCHTLTVVMIIQEN